MRPAERTQTDLPDLPAQCLDDQLSMSRDFGVLGSDDARVCQKPKAELYELFGMAESGMTKAKMAAVDALYKEEYNLVCGLNAFLEEYPFGPYDHISQALNEVAHLRKKEKMKEADQLNGLMKAFAVSLNCKPEAFAEWPALMKLKRTRDAYAHPFDKAYLVAEMKKENADLTPFKAMLTLLLDS